MGKRKGYKVPAHFLGLVHAVAICMNPLGMAGYVGSLFQGKCLLYLTSSPLLFVDNLREHDKQVFFTERSGPTLLF